MRDSLFQRSSSENISHSSKEMSRCELMKPPRGVSVVLAGTVGVNKGVHLFISQKGDEQRVDSVFHRSPSEKGDDNGVDVFFHSLDDLS